jgi:hypothetical protein
VWRSSERTRSIICEGKRLAVTESCYILIAFPEEYSEIVWEEIRLQLYDVLDTTIIPLLRVINLRDVQKYISNYKRWVFVFYVTIRALILQLRIPPRLYYAKLLGFLLSNICRYAFLEYLIREIIAYLAGSADFSYEDIAKGQTLLGLDDIIKGRDKSGEHSPTLEQLVQIDGKLNENINANVGIALGNNLSVNCTNDALRVACKSWKPIEPERPSSLERIAMAHFISSISVARLVEEMGIEAHDTIHASDLSALGMNSLMGHSIIDSLREKTGLFVPADFLRTDLSISDIEHTPNVGQLVESAPRPARVTTVITANTSVEFKTLAGFVLARRKLYSLAKRVLKDAIPEIEARYGPTSWELGIAVAECVKCCNMTEEQRMGEQLAHSTLLRRPGLGDRADSQYLRIALADSLLAGSNYNGAVEVLDGVIAVERGDPSVVLKAALRLSKAHQRLSKVFPSPKITFRLAHRLQVLDQANDELRSAFTEEIERNVSQVDTSNVLLYSTNKVKILQKHSELHATGVTPKTKFAKTRTHC